MQRHPGQRTQEGDAEPIDEGDTALAEDGLAPLPVRRRIRLPENAVRRGVEIGIHREAAASQQRWLRHAEDPPAASEPAYAGMESLLWQAITLSTDLRALSVTLAIL